MVSREREKKWIREEKESGLFDELIARLISGLSQVVNGSGLGSGAQ